MMERPNTRVQRTRVARCARPGSPLTRHPLGGVRRFVVFMAVAVGMSSCRRPVSWGTPAFDAEIMRLRVNNRCEKAIALLVEADAQDDWRWYDQLILAKLDCFPRTAQDPRDRDEVLALVNEGIRRFPRSSRLVFAKGWINTRFGEIGLARKYYQDALDLANANILEDKNGRNSGEDRRVAENARWNLGSARRPGS
jgi:hypothetical protein